MMRDKIINRKKLLLERDLIFKSVNFIRSGSGWTGIDWVKAIFTRLCAFLQQWWKGVTLCKIMFFLLKTYLFIVYWKGHSSKKVRPVWCNEKNTLNEYWCPNWVLMPIASIYCMCGASTHCMQQHFGSPAEFLLHTKACFPPMNCEVQQFIFTEDWWLVNGCEDSSWAMIHGLPRDHLGVSFSAPYHYKSFYIITA